MSRADRKTGGGSAGRGRSIGLRNAAGLVMSPKARSGGGVQDAVTVEDGYPADLQDRDGALLVLDRQTRRLFPYLETIFADGGQKLRRAMADAAWRIELVKRSAQVKGLEVIPRRWVVERTIAFIRLASIGLRLRRLTRYCYPS